MKILLVTTGRRDERVVRSLAEANIELFFVNHSNPHTLMGRRFDKIIVTYDAGKELHFMSNRARANEIRYRLPTHAHEPARDYIEL